MNLRDAVQLVWDDVADCVYSHPRVTEAVDYARNLMSPGELESVFDDQRSGRYDGAGDVTGDVYGAYVDVRNATQEEINNVIATFDVDLH